jgi:hypothetical protein
MPEFRLIRTAHDEGTHWDLYVLNGQRYGWLSIESDGCAALLANRADGPGPSEAWDVNAGELFATLEKLFEFAERDSSVVSTPGIVRVHEASER